MLFKTRGIALNFIKYRDTSIIARVYTEAFGKQSYIINGIRSQKSKKSIGNFQPLTLLDLVVYKSKNKDIHRLSEYKCLLPFKSIPYNVKKSAIAIFLTEIMVKVLDENPNEENEQFDFLFNSIAVFDDLEKDFESFHIFLLLKLTFYLGFGVSEISSVIEDGDEALIQYLEILQQSNTYQELPTNRRIRNKALESIINFYRHHIDSFGKIKSLEIMHQVFD